MDIKGNTGKGKKAVTRKRKVTEGYKERVDKKRASVEDRTSHPEKGKKVIKK